MQRHTKRTFIAVCLAMVVVTCVAMILVERPDSVTRSRVETAFDATVERSSTDSPDDRQAKNQKSAKVSTSQKATQAKQPESVQQEPADFPEWLEGSVLGFDSDTPVGYSRPVSVRDHPAVQKVSHDLRRHGKASATNQFQAGAPFDPVQYQIAPEEYLNSVEPGRVFDTAERGPDVPELQRITQGFTRVLQGESVVFKAKTSPGAPVSFTSAKLGEFENRLTAITVAANDEGIAEVTFKTTRGTQGDIDVMAASPVASGQVHFYVNVEVPGTR